MPAVRLLSIFQRPAGNWRWFSTTTAVCIGSCASGVGELIVSQADAADPAAIVRSHSSMGPGRPRTRVIHFAPTVAPASAKPVAIQPVSQHVSGSVSVDRSTGHDGFWAGNARRGTAGGARDLPGEYVAGNFPLETSHSQPDPDPSAAGLPDWMTSTRPLQPGGSVDPRWLAVNPQGWPAGPGPWTDGAYRRGAAGAMDALDPRLANGQVDPRMIESRFADPRLGETRQIDPRIVHDDPRLYGVDPRASFIDPRYGIGDARSNQWDPQTGQFGPTAVAPGEVSGDPYAAPLGPGRLVPGQTVDGRGLSVQGTPAQAVPGQFPANIQQSPFWTGHPSQVTAANQPGRIANPRDSRDLRSPNQPTGGDPRRGDNRNMSPAEQYVRSLDPDTRTTLTGGWGLQNPSMGTQGLTTAGGRDGYFAPNTYQGAGFQSWQGIRGLDATPSGAQRGMMSSVPASSGIPNVGPTGALQGSSQWSNLSTPSATLGHNGLWNMTR